MITPIWEINPTTFNRLISTVTFNFDRNKGRDAGIHPHHQLGIASKEKIAVSICLSPSKEYNNIDMFSHSSFNDGDWSCVENVGGDVWIGRVKDDYFIDRPPPEKEETIRYSGCWNYKHYSNKHLKSTYELGRSVRVILYLGKERSEMIFLGHYLITRLIEEEKEERHYFFLKRL